MWSKPKYCGQLQNHVWIANFCGGIGKLPYSEIFRISSWSYDMEGHAKKCVERHCELANRTTQQLYKVSTPCIDDHHFREEEMKSVGELSHVCSHIVLKCLYLARIGRPDILWSVNKLARAITKWTKACDKRLNRLISYIHPTCEYKQYCHVGNTAKQCRLGLFQDSDFAGDLEDSKSTSGGTLCIFGSHTFVPISWMCKKQTSVSHSSTESEIISLDTGLRLDGLPALELWDLIVSVLGNVFCVSDGSGKPVNGKNTNTTSLTNWRGKGRTLVRFGKFSWKTLIWENQHHFSKASRSTQQIAKNTYPLEEETSMQNWDLVTEQNAQVWADTHSTRETKEVIGWNIGWCYKITQHSTRCTEGHLRNKRPSYLHKVTRNKSTTITRIWKEYTTW